MGRTATLAQCWRETDWPFLKDLGTELAHNPAVPLVGRYPKITENGDSGTCTPMFIAGHNS